MSMIVKGMIYDTLIVTKGMGTFQILPKLAAVPTLVQVKTVAARMVVEAEAIGMWLMVFGLWIMLK